MSATEMNHNTSHDLESTDDSEAHASDSNAETQDDVVLSSEPALGQKLQQENNAGPMSPEVRWSEAANDIQYNVVRQAQYEGQNDAKARWRRAVFMTKQLINDNAALKPMGVRAQTGLSKNLETQHWLELVDGKHRYGSNRMAYTSFPAFRPLFRGTQYYHRRWLEEDTEENFFRWLDRGGGKDLSLEECPREQLEKQRITYLSAEQRLNYLVETDQEGKLRWAKSHELVDTSAGKWRDAGPDRGIVSDDDQQNTVETGSTSSASISPGSIDSANGNAAMHYTNDHPGHGSSFVKTIKDHFTSHGVAEKLLKKTVRKNTWIYVSDKNFNIFVGIKLTGTFQHSSFLSGGLVTSAGLISVKEGVIHTLSPLSGHYRTNIDHFKVFIDVLEKRGVDMHRAEISKAEVSLWGVATMKKIEKAPSKLLKALKLEVKNAASKTRSFALHDNLNASSWKKDILEGRKKVMLETPILSGKIEDQGAERP